MIIKKDKIRKKIILSLVIFILILVISISLSTISYAKANDNKKSDKERVRVNTVVDKKMTEDGLVDVIIMVDYDSDSNATQTINTQTTSTQASVTRSDNSNGKKNPRISSNIRSNKIISSVKGFHKRYDLDIINGYSGTLTRQGLEELRQQAQDNGLNIRVFENKVMHIQSELNESTAAVNANYSLDVLNITGRGVIVAMIDTGVDYTHPDLGNCTNVTFLAGNCSKVIGGYNFVNGNNNSMDDNIYGHGTHVAGILAANGSIRGVAPDARLYALKACDSGGSCNSDNVILAMQWAKNNSARIISLSLGIIGDPNEVGNIGKDPFSQAIDNIVSDGLVVVISAGNAGPAVSTIEIPGASESAITVGAIDDHNTVSIDDDTVWFGSSRGPGLFGRLDPDISAPGVNIFSTCLGGGTSCSLTGTSMSTAFVSGAVALLLEQNSTLTPSEIRTILVQSTSSISGKVFERGSGELNIRNALGKVYANVSHIDSYGRPSINDRWEFVVTPYTTEYASITLINNNDYNISFSTSTESITNLENNIILDGAQIGIPQIINISNNSNYTFSINFTLADFNNTFATTYGGVIFLNGLGDNGTDNVTKSVRIPVVITVPFTNQTLAQRTMNNAAYGDPLLNFDVYHYCYYNARTKNVTVYINWSSSSDDLDLYLYNSTGDFIVGSGEGKPFIYESVYTTNKDKFKWFKVNGFDFISPITFNINITTVEILPSILNVTPVGGIVNGINKVLFYRPDNITLNISYMDSNNDSVNVTINDSGFVLISSYGNTSNGSTAYSAFNKAYNSSLANSTILITLTDSYGSSVSQELFIILQSSVILNGHTPDVPSSSIIYVRQNDSLEFTVDAEDVNNKSLFYYWSINGTVVNQSQNFTFNTTNFNTSLYDVSVLISNNDTNNDSYRTVSWNVFVDGIAPSISILSPSNSMSYSRSKIDINYSATDMPINIYSGVDHCWYNINSTLNATILSEIGCLNASIYLSNADYTLDIYAIDLVGNIGNSYVMFRVNDTFRPNMTNSSPSGTLSYVTSVTISILTDENATCKYDALNVSYDSMAYNFTDNVTQHIALNYPVATGANTIYARCRDMSNNTDDDSTIITFSVSSAPPGGGNPGDGGNGGSHGSGGTGSISGGFDPNPGSASKTYGKLGEGITNFSVNKKDIPVSQVSFNSSSNMTNVTVTISKTDTPEKNYSLDSYAYIMLNTSNIPSNASFTTEIYFNVAKKWLDDSNLSNSEVVLLEYNPLNDSWDILSTIYLSEDANNSYFVSIGLRPGLYVISTNRNQVQEKAPEIKKPETNKSIEKNATLHVTSEPGSSGNSKINDIINNVLNGLKRQKDLIWILWVLLGTFVLVVAVILLIRKEAVKHFKNELIMATDKEFEDSEKVLVQKVPDVPRVIRSVVQKDVRQETGRKKSEELEKDINALKKSVEKSKRLIGKK